MIGADDGKNPIDFHHIQSSVVMLGIGIIVSRRLKQMKPLATELAEQSMRNWMRMTEWESEKLGENDTMRV